MAEHGTSNGYSSTGTLARLRKLLEEHERKAEALRTSLALLTESQTTTKHRGQTSVLAEALAIDRARVAKKRGRPKREAERVESTTKHAQRQRTADILSRFNTQTPMTIGDTGIDGRLVGVLTRHGYLKKKGEGYVRTPVEFVV
jgi:hypothetical protein